MLDKLLALGATITSGHVALGHVYLGQLLADGEVLMHPDGEAHIKELLTAPPAFELTPELVPEAPAKQKRAARNKAVVVAPDPEEGVDPVDDDMTSDLFGAQDD